MKELTAFLSFTSNISNNLPKGVKGLHTHTSLSINKSVCVSCLTQTLEEGSNDTWFLFLSSLKDINFSLLTSVRLSRKTFSRLPLLSSFFFGLLIPGISNNDFVISFPDVNPSHDFLVSLMAILAMGMIIITHTSLSSLLQHKKR